ncbi:hypothetical protein [Corynebacterium heidelbergense]|uniref:Immunity repressor n=1 Tax=Corynebacterium heidelbergense TaxID=2055947 RepID=A0A364VDM6_9CORY|nr:hypothetical protein [Corynebacterium heidelbergense]RAV34749.1 hypothetical protein CWC39_01495 [Corynebacterium heidelbergense]WCZ37009.1 hypothetical protein CHEID_07380 [Corynebacterium heidelbergense]
MTNKQGTPDPIKWLSETTGQRITVTRIGQILGVSRNTARSRLDDGLAADDVVTLARGLGVNPVSALQELGYVTTNELFDALDSDGTLLAAAPPDQLVKRLAEDMLTPEQKLELGRAVFSDAQLASVTPIRNRPRDVPTVPYDDQPEDAVADSSPDVGGDLDDLDR